MSRMEECVQMFLQTIMIWKHSKHSFIGETSLYFKHCYVPAVTLTYQAKSVIANGTRKFGLCALKTPFSKNLTFDFSVMFL